MAFTYKQRITSLDGWRGLAILFVFFYHYMPVNPINHMPLDSHNPFAVISQFGWCGVDLFFVLSGFLITGILYDTRQSSNFFKTFYARRALRLFPVYFCAILVIAICTGFFQGQRDWRLIPFFLYGANVMMIGRHGIHISSPYFSCGHLWSLAVEEQFYSCWPIIVFFVASRKKLAGICLSGIAAAIVFRVLLIHYVWSLTLAVWTAYFLLPTRMDSLLAGALLAIGVRGAGYEKWLRPGLLWWVVGAGCAILVFFIASTHSFNHTTIPMASVGFTVLAVTFAAILGLALLPGTIPNRIGQNSVLRFFGRYSYGFYIWHELIHPICQTWIGTFERYIHPLVLAHMAYMATTLALFTAIAVASYHLLEVRFLKMKSKFVAKPAMIAVEAPPLESAS